MHRLFIAVDLPDDARVPPEGEGFIVTNEHYEHPVLNGAAVDFNDVISHLRALVNSMKEYMPDADDLIEAAQALRAASDNMLEAEGSQDATLVDAASERASRLLEQVAIATMSDGAERDTLLEGRTDLGQPSTTLTPPVLDVIHSIDPDDETTDAKGRPFVYGRCDTCGAPCDEQGCTIDRSHIVAIP